MHKFAHFADAHLGAHREPKLRRMELQVFDDAMGKCVEMGVDFVLASGDIFHVGIPDLAVVNAAVRSMMKVRNAGIPIYAIYGSHDYTPNGTSIIDVLETAGVIVNVFKHEFEGDRLKLRFTVDEKTGAKVTGISARKIGLESKYYEALDKGPLEEESGPKLFLFHSGLTELKPEYLSEMETVGVDVLPKGFDYYAGGHIHQRGEYKAEGRENIVFPGPLFTGYGVDLEATARGERRGLYVAEFDDALRSKRFVPVGDFGGVYREYELGGINAVEAGRRVREDLHGVDVEGKLVVIRAHGELAGGRVSEVGFAEVRERLSERGALHVYLNTRSLKSKEAPEVLAVGQDASAIERTMFERGAGQVRVSAERLKGQRGAATAVELLDTMRQRPKLGEQKREYGSKMTGAGMRIMGLEESGAK